MNAFGLQKTMQRYSSVRGSEPLGTKLPCHQKIKRIVTGPIRPGHARIVIIHELFHVAPQHLCVSRLIFL